MDIYMHVFSLQNLQDMDERRIKKMAQGYIQFSDTERQVMPIIGKCLEGITRAGTNVNERNVSRVAFLRSVSFSALNKREGVQSCSRRAIILQSLAPVLIKHT